ncbi:MAG: FG-GAP-like repeat-containing protein, partial [Roseiarcus sp.]
DLGVVGASWQIAGTGDFNGDGHSDILWRNSNGDTELWNSNGSGGFAGQDLGVVGTSWSVHKIFA